MKRLLLILVLLFPSTASAQWTYGYYDHPYYHPPNYWDMGWPASARYGRRPINFYHHPRCSVFDEPYGYYGYEYWGARGIW